MTPDITQRNRDKRGPLVREDRDTARKRQVCAILDPETFATVQGMAQTMERPLADVVRQLTAQAIAVLSAAAQAEREGRDPERAAIDAARDKAERIDRDKADEQTTLALLDAFDAHLRRVAMSDTRTAVLLASGAATALRGWADQEAERHGTTVADLMEAGK